MSTAQGGMTADKRGIPAYRQAGKIFPQITQWATSFSRGTLDHMLPGWAMSRKTLLNIKG